MVLNQLIKRPILVGIILIGMFGGAYSLLKAIPQEYVPREDRGSFFIMVRGPEGASFDYMKQYMDEIERRILPYTETNEVNRVLVRAPGFGSNAFNQASSSFRSLTGVSAGRASRLSTRSTGSCRTCRASGPLLSCGRALAAGTRSDPVRAGRAFL